jgi:hypothetical protein
MMGILQLRTLSTITFGIAVFNLTPFHSILLLQRGDIDTSLKDSEGYRAFDLYNTTVEDTMPNKRETPRGLELYTWGSNR